MFKKTLLATVLGLSLLPMAACNDDDDDHKVNTVVIDENMTENKSIAEVIVENENFSILEQAIDASSYANVLNSGEFTVFAPTDDAFTALLDELDITAETLLADQDLLDAVLSYHVLGNMTVESMDIPYGDSIETLNGQAFSISNANVIMDAKGGTSNLIDIDNLTNNGVIHVIDEVLMPTDKTIVDLATDVDDLSILKEAVIAAGLKDALADEDDDLTVFAPTNAAFEQLLADLGISKEALLDNEALLTEVLTYHVVAEDRIFASEIEAGTQNMLNGGQITFDANKQITDSKGNKVNVTIANQQAVNGVVHVVDRVMLPSAGS